MAEARAPGSTFPQRSLHWLGQVFALVAVYALSGWLGLKLAVPPEHATAVFPPAGIALGALLVAGSRLWPGVWLGSLAVQVSALPDMGSSSAWITAACIASGATLQALVGNWLVRRYAGYPGAMLRPPEVLRMLALGGPAACLISASVGTLALFMLAGLPSSNVAWNWATWWGGDTLGVLAFAPLLLCLFGEPREEWRRRRLTVGAPLAVCFVCAVLVFAWADRIERERIAERFELDAAANVGMLHAQMRAHVRAVQVVASFMQAMPRASRQDFARFTRDSLQEHRALRSLQWVARVPGGQMLAFEQAVRREAAAVVDPRLREVLEAYRVKAGTMPAVAGTEERYPIRYMEPWLDRVELFGLDYGAEPLRRATLDRARDSGAVALSPPLVLTLTRARGLLVAAPVYEGMPVEVDSRRQRLLGFAAAGFFLDDVAAVTLPGVHADGLLVQIEDVTEAGAPQLLYASGWTQRSSEQYGLPIHRQTISVAMREWQVSLAATPHYITLRRGMSTYLSLISAVLMTVVVGATMLLLTGHVQGAERMVRELSHSGAESARKASELSDEVVQRRQTENALRRSEAQLRMIADGMPALICYLDASQIFRFVNRTGEQLYRLPRERIVGHSVREVIGDANYAHVRPYLEKALLGEAQTFARWAEKDEQGNVRELEVAYQPHREDDKVLGVFGIVSDITQRRRSESFQRLAAIVESSGDAIIGLDADGRIESWNPAASRLYGWSLDEARRQSVAFLAPPTLQAQMLAAIDRVLTGERVELEDFKHQHREGYSLAVSLVISPIRTSQDAVDGAALIVHDRGEVMRAERLFAMAVSAAPYATIMVNSAGDIRLANRAASELFGYSEEELLRMHVDSLVPASYRRQHLVQREAYTTARKPRAMGGRKVAALHRSGNEIPVDVGLSPLETPEGPMVVVGLVDITTRHLAERALAERSAALERVNAELARSNRDMDDFLRVASHDLKAPLRGILNLTDWISKDAREVLPEKSQRHLELLRGRAERMARLLDDVQRYARAGVSHEALTSFDAATLFAEACAACEVPASFDVVLMGEAPLLQGCRAPLLAALTQLIANAIKHHDHPRGRVEVAFARNTEEFSCQVSDDGPGVPPAYRERVFGPFQTLRPRDEVEASGVGLAIVKRVIEGMGGRVWVESKAGRGASFGFAWPVPAVLS